MTLVIFAAGCLVGTLISGSLFVYLTLKADDERNKNNK